ncbi:MAG: PEP-CTERM sorting domain-containing protein [Phycisphaerales bacterium]|jgi:hypothetical protein|nr:PEP-CTERM sorting domain-containing protein [Phycisphaerales bacterium]
MRIRNKTKCVLALTVLTIAALVLPAASATAAVIAFDASVEVSDNHSVVNVSVFPGKAGYDDGVDSGDFGDGTVLDYRFFNGTGDVAPPTRPLITYVDGGAGLISAVTATNTSTTNGGNLSWSDVWTTNDPGTNFSGGAAANFTSDTWARAQGIDGTIDISGLVSGTVYFFHGTFDDASTVTLTMTGSGQADLPASYGENPGGRNKGYITSFNFTDAGDDYDTITWNYTNDDTDASRARFMGVIIDGTPVPEPATMSLLALGGIALLKRRRRA